MVSSRVIAGTTILVWVAAGCGPRSQIDSKSSVIVTGSIVSESGGAPGQTTVKLIRHPDALQALGQVFVAVGSLGLACLGGQLDICSSFEESPADGSGGYTFAMKGSDTQGSVGQALTFTVFDSGGAQRGNCAVASDFQIQRDRLTIPPLRYWTATGTLADDAQGNGAASWPALEASVGGAAADGYKVTISDGTGALWWVQDAGKTTAATIDRRVLQDRDGNWIVIARRTEPGDGTDFDNQWYAPAQPYPNRNLTPLSRAADCYTQGADGNPSLLARPCPLTDGNPTTKFVPVQPPPCPMGQTCMNPPVNNWIMIDLGFSHPLGAIVLYDVSVSSPATTIVVETSNDMTTWTPAATTTAAPYQLLPLSGAAAQYVRLRLTDPKAQFYGGANGEVAVYAPI